MKASQIQGALEVLQWLDSEEGSIEDRRGSDLTKRRLQRALTKIAEEPPAHLRGVPESPPGRPKKTSKPAAKKAAKGPAKKAAKAPAKKAVKKAAKTTK